MVSYGYASLSGDAATHSILYAGGVMTDVDLLLSASFGSQSSNIFGISADGSVAVGYYMLSGMYNYRGFYYANGVVSDMGDLGGPNYNYAAGVSGDGSTLYGNASLQAGGMHAVTLALSYVQPTTITTSIDASDARVTSGGALQFQGGTLAPVGTGALTLVNDITVLASSTGTLDATTQDIASTGAVTINGTSLTLTGSATSAISLAGLVSGTGGLINDGGVNTLAQSSTYTGATVVNAGKLIQVDASQSAAIQIAAGATFEFKATSAIAHSGDTVFTGVGTLLKTGAGELGWYETSATFNFSRGALIHVAEGSLIGGSTANEDWSNNHSDLQVDAGAGFQGIEADVRVNRLMGGGVISSGYSSPYHGFTVGVDGGDGLFTGTIVDTAQGSGQIAVIIKTGAGELALSGVNTYSGGTILQAGALRAGNNAAFGSGTITLNAGVLSSDGSTARTLANALDIAGDATLGDAVKTGALTLAGPVSVGSGKIIAVASDVTVSGAVTSAGGFTKAGLGVLTLSASGTIAASSLVVAGGTLVNSGAITADVSVATGATLRGSGAITGTITLAGVGAAGQAGALIIEAPNGGSSYGSQSII
ncbi:hypothetical protein EBR16_06400, partial [bacterium]|nr:hypothetical protein [bacterium]